MEAYGVGLNTQLQNHTLLATVETTLAPLLFARKLAHDTIRVWVVGCETGEVAYVVASLLHAYAQQRVDPPGIQLFATDNDASAIALARHGQYPEHLAATLAPEWLQYFFYDGQHYQVTTSIRNLITFAQHRLLQDPPFAKLDLIVCRSTLAEFAADAQELVLRTLHWSLRPSGYLVSNIGNHSMNLSELFVAYVEAAGVYQRRNISPTIPYVQPRSAAVERQSIDETLRVANQHLQTMNQVLRRKVSDLRRANNDLNNLLTTTGIATVFLDRALNITRFTPQAQELFNLIPADRGRPLAHITHQLDFVQLVRDVESVMSTLQTSEREVSGTNGRWYLVRMSPYRTTEEQIDGVVLVCLDITARRLAEAEVQRARDELEQRVLERTQELSAANSRLQVEIAERTRLEQERGELLRRLVMTQEDERRRIARELHDQLGQSVSALGMGLGMLANPALDAAQHQQYLARLQQITAQLDQDMKRLAMELRPSVLDDLGLIEAIQHHVERWAEHTGIQAEFQAIAPEDGRLPDDVESVIYRVVQEALTNVLKHAQASNVSVILEQRRDHILVIVEDDGHGFDLDALQQAPNLQQRLGLLGMRERVALVGGTATIETAMGAGTTLFVQLPTPVGGSTRTSGFVWDG
jgi:signal transduction histidine kinase/chemotaxis methyl-accepting protein methylase